MRVAQAHCFERRDPTRAGAAVAWTFHPGGVVLRSRIVLLAAEGLPEQADRNDFECSSAHGGAVGGRFIERGIEGLLKDAPRPGRTPSICRAWLIEKTTQSTPATATQWSTRTMAREMGISKASVSRIWRAAA